MELRSRSRSLVRKPYSCPDCGRGFNRKSHLVRHQRLHTGEKPFQCPDCGKTFRQSTDVNTHRRIHTGETPYQCNQCGKCFRYRTGLVKHLRCHEEEQPQKCTQCGKTFGCAPVSNAQQRDRLGGNDRCPNCDRSVEHLDLVIHVASPTTEEPYECPDCGKSFSCSFQLIRHRNLQTRFFLPNPNDLCSFDPALELPLSDHLEAKERESPGSICEAYEEAMAKDCQEENPFSPTKPCRTLLGRLRQLVGQRREAFKEKPHVEKWLWKKPEAAGGGSPEDERGGDAAMCEEDLFPERRHLCFMCGKRFRFESHLIAHERIHTGEKPFRCSNCPKSFRDRSDMHKHQKVHFRQKPFRCLDCGRRFHHQLTFIRHQRLHPTETVCQQGCLYLALLPSYHPGEEIVAGDRAEPPKTLSYTFKQKDPTSLWTLEASDDLEGLKLHSSQVAGKEPTEQEILNGLDLSEIQERVLTNKIIEKNQLEGIYEAIDL